MDLRQRGTDFALRLRESIVDPRKQLLLAITNLDECGLDTINDAN